MYNNKRILAIIPARGGSKGVKRKNIKLLNGKPLIWYTIEAAKKSEVIDKIIVSTDDEEIADVAKKFGAEVPFMRPSNLASDTSSSMDVYIHAIEWINNNFEERYDYILILQPTSPLRSSDDIIASIELVINKDANSVVSVCKVDHHPYWTNTLDKDLALNKFIKKEAINKNRQELPDHYRLNGAIYIAKPNYLLKNRNWYKEDSYAYIMPRVRSVDIDSEIDFTIAEVLIKKQQSYKTGS